MKILLVAANRERDPYPVAPLGALLVAAAARATGHDIVFLDLGLASHPIRALRRALDQEIQAVAFSIRNLDNCAFFTARSYAGEVQRLAETVRRFFAGPLILGGSGFSVAPRGWMRRLDADYGIVGEGERALGYLLDGIASGREIASGSGVLRGRRGGDADTSPVPPIENLDALAPAAHELCRYSRYLTGGGFVSVQTKRGCPFGCVYCIYPQLEGRRYRLRSPELVADEVEEVGGRFGARHFFFVDSVFNDPRDHALAVCEALIRRRLAARWMAFCNPVGLDLELSRAMARAGCVGIEFGLDAATEKMLTALRKPFGQEAIRTGLQAVQQAGLPFAIHMLFGGPGETWRDVEAAQLFLDDCAPPNGVFASFGIRIYEGTPLARQAVREGVLPAGLDLFDPTFYISPDMASDPGGNLDRIVRRRPAWTSPVDWRRLTLRWIRKFMNRLGERPQWRHVRNYGLHLRRGAARAPSRR